MKTKRLSLTFPHLNPHAVDDDLYRIEKVVDTTEFTPGQYLTKQQVDELCLAKSWSVSITKSWSASITKSPI